MAIETYIVGDMHRLDLMSLEQEAIGAYYHIYKIL
jgi:hypothetical protein